MQLKQILNKHVAIKKVIANTYGAGKKAFTMSSKDLNELLQSYWEQDNGKLSDVAELVCGSSDNLAVAMARMKSSKEVEKAVSAVELNKIEQAVVDRMKINQGHTFKTFTDDVKKYAGEVAIEKAAELAAGILEKARPIEIKVGKAKAKKVKGVVPENFEHMLNLAANRINILMVGPSGSGKTTIAGMIADALDLDYASISCSVGMSESMLTGWLLPLGDSGKFEHVPTEFINKYEKGGVFLLDEIDAADPNTMVFINQAIAQDHFFLPQRFNKPLVKKHNDFILIAAANTFGNGADMMFVGRNQLDAATLDRFRAGLVTVDYSPVVEQTLVNPAVLEWGLAIRGNILKHKLRRIMSTRFMLDITKLIDSGVYKEPADCEAAYFMDWTDHEIKQAKEKPVGGHKDNLFIKYNI